MHIDADQEIAKDPILYGSWIARALAGDVSYRLLLPEYYFYALGKAEDLRQIQQLEYYQVNRPLVGGGRDKNFLPMSLLLAGFTKPMPQGRMSDGNFDTYLRQLIELFPAHPTDDLTKRFYDPLREDIQPERWRLRDLPEVEMLQIQRMSSFLTSLAKQIIGPLPSDSDHSPWNAEALRAFENKKAAAKRFIQIAMSCCLTYIIQLEEYDYLLEDLVRRPEFDYSQPFIVRGRDLPVGAEIFQPIPSGHARPSVEWMRIIRDGLFIYRPTSFFHYSESLTDTLLAFPVAFFVTAIDQPGPGDILTAAGARPTFYFNATKFQVLLENEQAVDWAEYLHGFLFEVPSAFGKWMNSFPLAESTGVV
jgi:hypothetical protein